MSTSVRGARKEPSRSCVKAYGRGKLRQLFRLEKGVTYLNHGSYGLCPSPVMEAYQEWQRRIERQPAKFFRHYLPELLSRARGRLAAYVNCAAEELVFVRNTTTGLNTAIRSLSLGPQDEILASDQEYGALENTWSFICSQSGSRYRRCPILLPVKSKRAFIENFWKGVTEHTRVIFISHISASTGIIFPIAEIIRRARARGIITIIDGAHALGQIPIDLKALNPDIYVSSAHKWLCAPKGCAFLYVRKDYQPRITPLVIGWGWGAQTDLSKLVQENQWQGTCDPSSYLATSAALDFSHEPSWESCRAKCHALAQAARMGAEAITKHKPLSPDEPQWYAQMTSVPLSPGCDPHEAAHILSRDFSIEVAPFVLNGQPLLRLCFQGYNSSLDLQKFLSALQQIHRGRAASAAHAKSDYRYQSLLQCSR